LVFLTDSDVPEQRTENDHNTAGDGNVQDNIGAVLQWLTLNKETLCTASFPIECSPMSQLLRP
jgi:hypothetical protein